MARKAKRAVKAPKKRVALWIWLIILIPLIVAILWFVSLVVFYNKIPLVYGERASPEGLKSLITLVFFFIISYGVFVLMEFRRMMRSI